MRYRRRTAKVRYGSPAMGDRGLDYKPGIAWWTLPNKLTVAIAPDDRANIVSVDVRYLVGTAEARRVAEHRPAGVGRGGRETERPLTLPIEPRANRVTELQLANGLRVLMISDFAQPVVEARLVFPVGDAAGAPASAALRGPRRLCSSTT